MGDSAGSTNDPGKSYRERRSVPRYGLIAQTEIVEPVSGLRISGRVSEMSHKGCYVDLLNTLPVQTVVEVRITRDRGTFVRPGKSSTYRKRWGWVLHSSIQRPTN